MLAWLLLLLVAVTCVYALLNVLIGRLRCRRRHKRAMTSGDASDACLLCCRPSDRSSHMIDRYQQSVRATEQPTVHSSNATVTRQQNQQHQQNQHLQQQERGVVPLMISRQYYLL